MFVRESGAFPRGIPKRIMKAGYCVFFDIKRAEDAAASLHGYIVVGFTYLSKCLFYNVQANRVSLQTRCQVGGVGVLVDVRAHFPDRLCDA